MQKEVFDSEEGQDVKGPYIVQDGKAFNIAERPAERPLTLEDLTEAQQVECDFSVRSGHEMRSVWVKNGPNGLVVAGTQKQAEYMADNPDAPRLHNTVLSADGKIYTNQGDLNTSINAHKEFLQKQIELSGPKIEFQHKGEERRSLVQQIKDKLYNK